MSPFSCRGMTLLEVIVAMAIFATAGITFMITVTEQVVAIFMLKRIQPQGYRAQVELDALPFERLINWLGPVDLC
ncbi:prepilin-type N-terminal cleavage/methylation domain-containing protein [uncultured Tolumonas sp.]|uniref:prepilin-type N-terminal cleavage/methylation domain-containing protein n=1 Tax=uncultured Tolumonas sp. TaxID=263765 RepID=UPI002A0A64FE|nr:prepilin-type N-terminal cleavage/methylation domain-containing protein [uncultured Tolumonas sp.]